MQGPELAPSSPRLQIIMAFYYQIARKLQKMANMAMPKLA